MTDNEKVIFGNAVNLWGEVAQIGMFHEEVGELMKALNKHARRPTAETIADVLGEMADVRNTLKSLEVIFGSPERQELAKVQRLAGRVKKAMNTHINKSGGGVWFLVKCDTGVYRFGDFDLSEKSNIDQAEILMDIESLFAQITKSKITKALLEVSKEHAIQTANPIDISEWICDTLCAYGIDTKINLLVKSDAVHFSVNHKNQ